MALNMFRKLVSKKQIQDIVNKGISDDEIEIGTKLYKHEITIVENNYVEGDCVLTLINDSNEEINMVNLSDYIESSLKLYIYDGDSIYILLTASVGIKCDKSDDSMVFCTDISISNVKTDDITPL